MLALIVTHGHAIDVVEKDVGGHQQRIREQAHASRFLAAFGRLVLELRHTAQFAHAGDAFEQPGQLAVLAHVALREQHRRVWIEPDGEKQGGHVKRRATQLFGISGDGQGVEVHQAVEVGSLVLIGDPPTQRAQVVAEMDVTGGLHTREHSGHGGHGRRGIPARPGFCSTPARSRRGASRNLVVCRTP
jgi:hypothetical protein